MASLRDLLVCRDPDGAALLELLQEYAEAHDGDVTDVEEALAPWWAEHDGQVSKKVDALAWALRELDARASAQASAAAELRKASDANSRAAERIRAYVIDAMREAGATSIRGSSAELRRQKNGGRVALRIEIDVAALPERYVRTTVARSADTDGIRAALERGEDVSGCHLADRSERLVIK